MAAGDCRGSRASSSQRPRMRTACLVGAVIAKVSIHWLRHWVSRAGTFVTDENGVVVMAYDGKLENEALPDAPITRMTPHERLEDYRRKTFPELRVVHVGDQMRESAQWLAPTLPQSFYSTTAAPRHRSRRTHGSELRAVGAYRPSAHELARNQPQSQPRPHSRIPDDARHRHAGAGDRSPRTLASGGCTARHARSRRTAAVGQYAAVGGGTPRRADWHARWWRRCRSPSPIWITSSRSTTDSATRPATARSSISSRSAARNCVRATRSAGWRGIRHSAATDFARGCAGLAETPAQALPPRALRASARRRGAVGEHRHHGTRIQRRAGVDPVVRRPGTLRSQIARARPQQGAPRRSHAADASSGKFARG